MMCGYCHSNADATGGTLSKVFSATEGSETVVTAVEKLGTGCVNRSLMAWRSLSSTGVGMVLTIGRGEFQMPGVGAGDSTLAGRVLASGLSLRCGAGVCAISSAASSTTGSTDGAGVVCGLVIVAGAFIPVDITVLCSRKIELTGAGEVLAIVVSGRGVANPVDNRAG